MRFIKIVALLALPMFLSAQLSFTIEVRGAYDETVEATLLIGDQSLDVDSSGIGIIEMNQGRYTLQVVASGYQSYIDANFLVRKPMPKVNIKLEPLYQSLDNITVKAPVSLAESQTLNQEKLFRIAGSYDDPSRSVAQMAGVTTVNDQSNHLSLYGFSPNYFSYTLDGIPITSPSHLSTAGTVNEDLSINGGGVLALSSQVIGSSQLQYERSKLGESAQNLAQLDLKSKQISAKPTLAFQAGLVGVEAKVESAIGETTKVLANARYSTFGLLGQLVDIGDEAIQFADFFGKIEQKIGKKSSLDLFVMFGTSDNTRDSLVESDEITEFRQTQNTNSKGQTTSIGSTFKSKLSEQDKLLVQFGFSSQKQSQQKESIDRIEIESQTIFGKISWKRKANKRFSFETGATYLDNAHIYKRFNQDTGDLIFGEQGLTPWIGLFHENTFWFTENLKQDAQVSLFFDLETEKVLPNLAYSLSYYTQQATFTIHADQLFLQNYHLGQVNDAPQSRRLSASYIRQLSPRLNVKGMAFFVSIQDEFSHSSTFQNISANNLLSIENIEFSTLGGNTENYGASISSNFSFAKSGFLEGNIAYFQGLDNSVFVPNYQVHLLAGNEWVKQKSWGNRIFGLSGGIHIRNTNYRTNIDVTSSEAAKRTIFEDFDPQAIESDTYFRVDTRLYFKKLKSKFNSTWSLDIQNVFNSENLAYLYYEPLTESVMIRNQLGIIPVLSYRIEF